MPNYRLTIEYQGTRYGGWQDQRNTRTIVGVMREAFVAAGADVIEIGGAGRTDRGVHALGQVAHLRLTQPLEVERLRRDANDALPHDIHVRSIERAPERFHARHDAEARSYLYQIARRRTAFGRDLVWWVKRDLDEARLRDAAARVAGRHDFRAFCEEPEGQTSTIVVVDRAEVLRAGDVVLVRIVASHFLWKMVRRLVGTFIEAAAGTIEPAQVSEWLADASRVPREGGNPAMWTAPPSGLFLERVLYADSDPLGPMLPVLVVR